MRDYWSCSKFADWLRGSKKLNSGTSKEWREWTAAAKAAHPTRYWLAEEGLDYVEKVWIFIPETINSVRYYLNNRFLVRTHSLTAHPRDIKPGAWCDVGNRFLPCLFNELVNYVEVEKAWMNVCWADEASRAKYDVPYWRRQWWTRWLLEWRCPQAGIDHLDWEIGLIHNEEWVDPLDASFGQPTYQAIRAKEVKDLYIWWTKRRPLRVDPYDASGWSAICDENRGDNILSILDEDRSVEDQVRSAAALETLRNLETQYEQEDEAMLIRLIKIRDSLWT